MYLGFLDSCEEVAKARREHSIKSLQEHMLFFNRLQNPKQAVHSSQHCNHMKTQGSPRERIRVEDQGSGTRHEAANDQVASHPTGHTCILACVWPLIGSILGWQHVVQ